MLHWNETRSVRYHVLDSKIRSALESSGKRLLFHEHNQPRKTFSIQTLHFPHEMTDRSNTNVFDSIHPNHQSNLKFKNRVSKSLRLFVWEGWHYFYLFTFSGAFVKIILRNKQLGRSGGRVGRRGRLLRADNTGT